MKLKKKEVMMMKRACVVGMGTAGASAALLLARSGRFQVTLLEQQLASNIRNTAGAGIGLQPVGLRVLERMGLLKKILFHGARVDKLFATTKSGRPVLDLKYADFHPELFGVGLHRSVLHNELLDAILADERIELHCGREVLSARVSKTDSHFAAEPNSNFVKMATGEMEGPFDLIIIADGRSSPVRQSLGDLGFSSYEQWYKFGCLFAILPENGFLKGTESQLTQRLNGCKQMLGFLPTGKAHGQKENLVSLFWSLDMSSKDKVIAQGIDKWKEDVLKLEPNATVLVDQISSFDDLIPAYYSNTFCPRLHYGNSLVFIGDAAHATSPQLGQGSNLALVDSLYLQKALEAENFNIEAALERFNRERKWRLRFYQLNSILLTPVFQSNSKLIGGLRDAFMGPLCQFGPTKTQMLATLCGAQANGIPYSFISEDEYVLYRS